MSLQSVQDAREMQNSLYCVTASMFVEASIYSTVESDSFPLSACANVDAIICPGKILLEHLSLG